MLRLSDATGQKSVSVSDVPTDATVGELVRELAPRMGLPATDPEGRPVSYHVHLEREGRHLRESEVAHPALFASQGFVAASWRTCRRRRLGPYFRVSYRESP